MVNRIVGNALVIVLLLAVLFPNVAPSNVRAALFSATPNGVGLVRSNRESFLVRHRRTPTPTPTVTATPIATATATPTPAPTPSPSAHFNTLPFSAALPTDLQCAALIAPSPETAAWNTVFNQIKPTAAELSSYASNGYTLAHKDSYTQYARVDGQYTGSTDMIMRWAACKYGIDEDIVRAQAWVESSWIQGGAGDLRTSEPSCVQGTFTSLWNTTIVEPDGSVVAVPNGCYQSWSAWQTKVYYDWMTWPEIMESTAFAADFRYADQRSCMNGAYMSYFAGAVQQPNTYAVDVSNYENAPSIASTDQMLWGCIGMHYSGSWYDTAAQGYINTVQQALSLRPWP